MAKASAGKRRDLSSSSNSSTPREVNRAKKPKSKKALKKEQQAAQDFEEEQRLSSLLFGGGPTSSSLPDQPKNNEVVEEDTPFSFEIDRTGISDGQDNDDEEASVEHMQEDEMEEAEDSGPAWVDDDDAKLEVNLLETSRLRKLRTSKDEVAASALGGVELEQRLRQRFQNTTQATARTDWARIGQKDGSDEDQSDGEDTALQSSSAPLILHSSASQRLPPNILNTMRCPDANQADPSQSVIQAVNFHSGSDPDRPLLLTGGLDKTLRFFQVGTEKSEKIHGIHCKLTRLRYPYLEVLFATLSTFHL